MGLKKIVDSALILGATLLAGDVVLSNDYFASKRAVDVPVNTVMEVNTGRFNALGWKNLEVYRDGRLIRSNPTSGILSYFNTSIQETELGHHQYQFVFRDNLSFTRKDIIDLYVR